MSKSAGAAILLLSLCWFVGSPLNADEGLFRAVRTYRAAHEHQIISEFTGLLSIPNVSSDLENIRKNAEFIRGMMAKRGIDARIIETKGNPVVFGELRVPGAARTILIYIHYDGQPVDQAKWTDTKPFVPALRPGKLLAGTHEPMPIPFPDQGEPYDENWRIYARGSSDDRAPIIGYMAALDALRDKDEEFAASVVEQIHDNAMIQAGLMVESRRMVERSYEIMTRALAGSAPAGRKRKGGGRAKAADAAKGGGGDD